MSGKYTSAQVCEKYGITYNEKKLVKEYIRLLSFSGNASDHYWAKVIKMEDWAEFSDDLKDAVTLISSR